MYRIDMDKSFLLADVIKQALSKGSDQADAYLIYGEGVSISQRLGRLDQLHRSQTFNLGARVFIGQRQALVTTCDPEVNPETLVERAVEMARAVPEDPHCGLAESQTLARDFPQLDLYSEEVPSIETLCEWIEEAEESALEVQGVTNSERAEGGWSHTATTLLTSEGFEGTYARSSHSVSVCVIAGQGTEMERDYDFSTAVYPTDLSSPRLIGRNAGEKAVNRLHPRKVNTQSVPVIYDPRASGTLLSHLSSAISGNAITRQTSFLKDSLEKKIFSSGIEVIDDPFVPRGLRSRPFDGEGLRPTRRKIIDDGYLTTWLLDLRSARYLGRPPTAHGGRSTGTIPSPSPYNLTFTPGSKTPQELIKEIKQGFYVTELIGVGTNLITGDYSRGAAGFWIEDGVLTFPVSEVTLAGNLKEMFAHLEVGSDLSRRYGIDAPTLRVDRMTVAGH